MSRISPFSKCSPIALLALLGCNVPIETEEHQTTPGSSPEDPSVVWTSPSPPDGDSPSTAAGEPASPSPEPIAVQIDRELLVVDPAVVSGPVASPTEPGAPLSLRTLLTWLVADERQTLVAAREWLGQWRSVTKVGAAAAPVIARPDVVPSLIEPWFDVPDTSPLGYSGAPTDTEAAEEESLWARTPFELLAVVNRIDLATGTCSGSAGELRFVYTAVAKPERHPLEMTLIIEVPYPATRPPAAWAKAWHELATKSAAAYPGALASLAAEVTRDADPFSVRLRTNEAALGASQHMPWELREFHLATSEHGRRFVMTPLEQTPRTDVSWATLAAAINARAEQIVEGGAPLPLDLRAGAAQVPVPTFTWTIPGVDFALRRAFSQQTCNGCHGGETKALPFQHIAPSLDGGPARLSRFLRNPDAPTDELRRRADIYAGLLRAECEDPSPGAGDYATE